MNEKLATVGRDLRMLDFHGAENVEISFGSNGELWVNVDGICRLRAKASKQVTLDESASQRVPTGIPNVHIIQPRR